MLPLWSRGFGERFMGGRIGGTRLYSPVSGLLNVVDFLACFQGTGGEIDEGMRKQSSPSCVVLNLEFFWLSPSATTREMTNGKAQGKTKYVKRVPNSQSVASVSANGLQI